MLLNTIITVVIIFLILSISGWVAATLVRLTPFVNRKPILYK